jgi:hypothetical protein
MTTRAISTGAAALAADAGATAAAAACARALKGARQAKPDATPAIEIILDMTSLLLVGG